MNYQDKTYEAILDKGAYIILNIYIIIDLINIYRLFGCCIP